MADNNLSTDKTKIKVVKDGPYIVSGGVPLYEQTMITDEAGHTKELVDEKKLTAKENYVLCRCGASKNKPYCDGTHNGIDFDGTETASRKPYLEYLKYLKVLN